MLAGAAVTAIGTAGLVLAEWRTAPRARWLFKPLASAGFLLAALKAPTLALPSGTGWLLLAGLALSAAGDVLLVPSDKRTFLAGIGAFALAHVAYGAWFVSRGVDAWIGIVALTLALGLGHRVWLSLERHVTGRLRLPVRLYVVLVSLMAASAAAGGATALGRGSATATLLAPAAGGLLFYLSDAAVARQRFVSPGFVNRAWGLPVYYAAQLLIASAVS
ncbi:MAG: lysoplasmalogenase [Aeromicrobium sp.]|nr:lysoplasmalogenase [Aeromicrobium sp.]